MSSYPAINDREFDLLKKITTNTALISDDEAGDVASVAGTAGEVLINGGTGPATGAVTASLAPTVVKQGGPLGTPSSANLSNATGLPLATGVTGTLPAANMPAHTGDVTSPAGSVAMTLATVNGNVGTFGSATAAPAITLNAKGLATAASNVTITPAVGSITGLGTGVATALAATPNATGGVVIFSGNIGAATGTSLNLNNSAAAITLGTTADNTAKAIRLNYSTVPMFVRTDYDGVTFGLNSISANSQPSGASWTTPVNTSYDNLYFITKPAGSSGGKWEWLYNGPTAGTPAPVSKMTLGGSSGDLAMSGGLIASSTTEASVGAGAITTLGGIYSTKKIVTSSDVEVLDIGEGFILKSPDGTRWRITINNAGAITTATA